MRWGRIAAIAVIALVGLVRIRLLDFPLERDEGEYAYAGQLILSGVPPYKLAYNMKFPGTYAAYAVIMALLGQTPAAIHSGVLIVTTLSALMLYWLGKEVLDELTGCIAAMTYAVMAALPSMLGLAGHATHFAAFFSTAGVCLIWRAQDRCNLARVAASGLMFGMAVLMKQHAIFFAIWGLLVVLNLRQLKTGVAAGMYRVGIYCAGALLPFAVACVVLWEAGVLGKFWFWAFRYGSAYVAIVPISEAPNKFLAALVKLSAAGSLLWLTAIAGLAFALLNNRMRAIRYSFVGLILAAGLTICPGFYFRVHYFLFLLPAVALLCGCACSGLRETLRTSDASISRWLPSGAYAVILGATVLESRVVWFTLSPNQASRRVYFVNPFAEAPQIAAFIQTNSTSTARLAILGSEPEICFLSRRRSATGYIYTYPLMELQPMAHQMQEEMIREIEVAQPEYIVYVPGPESWLPQPGSDKTIFNWWDSGYRTNYALTAVVEMDERGERKFVYGKELAGRKELVSDKVWVYNRISDFGSRRETSR
jgi:hypothetical protein